MKKFQKLVGDDLTMKTFHILDGKATGQTDLCPMTMLLFIILYICICTEVTVTLCSARILMYV